MALKCNRPTREALQLSQAGMPSSRAPLSSVRQLNVRCSLLPKVDRKFSADNPTASVMASVHGGALDVLKNVNMDVTQEALLKNVNEELQQTAAEGGR